MKIRILLAASVLGLAGPAVAQTTDWAKMRAEWNQPVAPFRILGNVHYVGTAGIAAYLITSPQGHILIDGGMPESAPRIAANIETLGFRLADVKILLTNHAHWDHDGGLAELKRRTGARLLASAADTPALEAGRPDYRPDITIAAPPVKGDATLTDGEEIRLGTNTLVAHLTPGHTKGCTSFTLQVPSGGDSLTVLFACSLSVADFRATFAKLRATQADVFLSFHAEQFDLAAKRAKQVAGDGEAFVDPGELARRLDAAQKAFEAALARERGQQLGGGACTPIGGGPAEGMCSGGVVWCGRGLSLVSLRPAVVAGAPLPASAAALLDRVLQTQARGEPIPADALADGASNSFYAAFDGLPQHQLSANQWPLDATYRAGRPFLLKDGRVRVEWSRQGELAYLTFFRLQNGQIAALSTAPAQVPVREPE